MSSHDIIPNFEEWQKLTDDYAAALNKFELGDQHARQQLKTLTQKLIEFNHRELNL